MTILIILFFVVTLILIFKIRKKRMLAKKTSVLMIECPKCKRVFPYDKKMCGEELICICKHRFRLSQKKKYTKAEREEYKVKSRQNFIKKALEDGNDLAIVSIGGKGCADCEAWENRVISISGKTKGIPTLQQAINAGLFHPGCRHSLMPCNKWILERYYIKCGGKWGYSPKTGPNS